MANREDLLYAITAGLTATSIEVTEGYGQPCSRANIITATKPGDLGLDLGDTIQISLGYDTGAGRVFTGYIKEINSERLPGQYIINASDVLSRAAEHMIVSEDPEDTFKRWDISMEDLVEDLLDEAGITNYVGDTSTFTLATGSEPAEFQLVFAMDAINQVAEIIAWHCWADHDGVVHFADLKPIPAASSSASFTTGSSGQILVSNRSISTENLRNKVVVLGLAPITAEEHESSPYLPAGFYKTAIISSVLIDSQSMADVAAEYNLEAWNRLTESVNVEILGDYQMHMGDTVTITEGFTGTSGRWFVRDCVHSFSASGFITRMVLVK